MSEIQINRAALDWRTASVSGANGCVEVAPVNEIQMVAVRHSKKPDAEVILYTAHEWRCFLDGAKGGEFDYFVS